MESEFEMRESKEIIEQKTFENIEKYEREKEKDLVNLIAKMIVDIAFKNVYEKGN